MGTFMTTAEAAARLRTSPEAVRKAIKRGRLEATQNAESRGMVYDVSEEALEAYQRHLEGKGKGGRPKK